MKESDSGTVLNSSVIIDQTGILWSLAASDISGLQVVKNATVDTSTANVKQLLYSNHRVYQQTGAQWFMPTASGAWIQVADPTKPTTESPDGTTLISTTGTIIDAKAAVWSLVQSTNGLRIAVNGTPDTTTAQVVLLLYYSHQVYQSNQAGGWWLWTGTGWADSADPRKPTPPSESPSGTTVSSATGTIIDSKMDKWTLTQFAQGSGLSIARNGIADPRTAQVAVLLYFSHQVYQQNQAGGWWMWDGISGWSDSRDPRLPAPAGNSIVVNLQAQTGATVSKMLYGLGSSGDMASDKFATTNRGDWQAQAKSLNMSLYRPNFGNSGLMKMIFRTQNADWSYIDTLLDNLPKFVDLNNCRILTTVGGHGPPPWCNIWTNDGQEAFADCCVQVAKRFESKGIHCDWWEFWNEPDGDGFDMNTYCALFNKFEPKMRSYAASIGRTYHLGGVTDTWMQANRIQQFCRSCKPDFLSYHQYSTGPGDGNFQPGNLHDTGTIMQKAFNDFGPTTADCRAAAAGTSAANLPIFLGEWNIVYTPDSGGGNYNIDVRQITNIGAVFIALATTSIVNANKNATMAAMWELYADTYYGVIRTDMKMSAQGRFLQRMNTYGGGQQVTTSVGGSMNMKALATVNGNKYCVVLMNYDQNTSYKVSVSGLSGSVTYYEISGARMDGYEQTISSDALGNLNIPAMSVIILTN